MILRDFENIFSDRVLAGEWISRAKWPDDFQMNSAFTG